MVELGQQKQTSQTEVIATSSEHDQKRQQHFAPFTTRLPFLTAIMIITIFCALALELGIRYGLSLDEKMELPEHAPQKRWTDDTQPQDPSIMNSPPATPSATSISTWITETEKAASSSASTYPQQTSVATTFCPYTMACATAFPINTHLSDPPQVTDSSPTASTTITTHILDLHDSRANSLYNVTSSERSWTDWTTSYIERETTVKPLKTTYLPPDTTDLNSPNNRRTSRPQAPPATMDVGAVRDDEPTTPLDAPKKHDGAKPSPSPWPSAHEGRPPDASLAVPAPLTASGVHLSGSPFKDLNAVIVSAILITNSNGDFATRFVPLASTSPAAGLNTALYAVLVTTQTIRDSTGGLSTLVASTRSYYSALVRTQLITNSTGGASTFVAAMTSTYSTNTPSVVVSQAVPSLPAPTSPPDQQRAEEVELGLALTHLQYFKAMYLPVLVADLLKLLWSTVFSSTKMMEPFYLLSRKQGISAGELASSEYLSSSLSIKSLRRIFSGDAVAGVSTAVYLLISFIPPLATQATTVRAIGWCPSATIWLRCNPMWYLNINFSRALQGILFAVALLVVVMMIVSSRRRTGVFSNPSSIAAIASLLNNEPFRETLREIPQTSSRSAVKEFFGSSRYKLIRHPTSTGGSSYGVVKIGATSASGMAPLSGHRRNSSLSAMISRKHPSKKSRVQLPSHLLQDIVFLLAILTLISILITYALAAGDTPIGNLFNNHSESRLVLALMASLFDGRWKDLERQVRVMTPYRRLHQGGAKLEATILVTQNGTPISSIVPALWRGNWFHVAIAFVAILSDVLIITISGVPYSSAQVLLDAIVCFYISIVMLGIMALAILGMFRWRALNEKMMMPREPAALVAVWMMLCNRDNGVCKEMQGSERMSARERDEKVGLRGGRYWAGWITQPGGTQRWCIEKESGKG